MLFPLRAALLYTATLPLGCNLRFFISVAESAKELADRMGMGPNTRRIKGVTVYDAVLMGRKPYMGLRVTHADRDETEAAIARALVQEPCLLLLDKPTSALDLHNQFEILTPLREAVCERGIAMVMTVHDLKTALEQLASIASAPTTCQQ